MSDARSSAQRCKRPLLMLAGAAACFGLAQWVAPRSRELSASPEVAALGPLRPLVAELRFLELLHRVEERRYAAALEDAYAIADLRPDSVSIWRELAYRLCLDLPGLESDPALRGAWFGVGIEFRDRMLERFPSDLSIARAGCWCLLSPLLADPERVTGAGLSLGEAFENCRNLARKAWVGSETELEEEQGRDLLRAVLQIGSDPGIPLSPEARSKVAAEAEELQRTESQRDSRSTEESSY